MITVTLIKKKFSGGMSVIYFTFCVNEINFRPENNDTYCVNEVCNI
jgi:hypothetical protein